jgi:hypothetical protein
MLHILALKTLIHLDLLIRIDLSGNGVNQDLGNYFRVADHPTRNGPIWYERSTNMRRHEDWILVGVTAVFRQ